MDAAAKAQEQAVPSTWAHRSHRRLTQEEMLAAQPLSFLVSPETNPGCRTKTRERSRYHPQAQPKVDSAAAAEVLELAAETALAADCRAKARAQEKTMQPQDAVPIPTLAEAFLLIPDQAAREWDRMALLRCPTFQFREARRKSSTYRASALLAATRHLPDQDVLR